ncbi:hypothetical protein HAX54_046637, partial [Datura stramonium]|nr:hypothetical protein [Datura stramonium]
WRSRAALGAVAALMRRKLAVGKGREFGFGWERRSRRENGVAMDDFSGGFWWFSTGVFRGRGRRAWRRREVGRFSGQAVADLVSGREKWREGGSEGDGGRDPAAEMCLGERKMKVILGFWGREEGDGHGEGAGQAVFRPNSGRIWLEKNGEGAAVRAMEEGSGG